MSEVEWYGVLVALGAATIGAIGAVAGAIVGGVVLFGLRDEKEIADQYAVWATAVKAWHSSNFHLARTTAAVDMYERRAENPKNSAEDQATAQRAADARRERVQGLGRTVRDHESRAREAFFRLLVLEYEDGKRQRIAKVQRAEEQLEDYTEWSVFVDESHIHDRTPPPFEHKELVSLLAEVARRRRQVMGRVFRGLG